MGEALELGVAGAVGEDVPLPVRLRVLGPLPVAEGEAVGVQVDVPLPDRDTVELGVDGPVGGALGVREGEAP